MTVVAPCVFLSEAVHSNVHAQTVRTRIAVVSLRPPKLRIDLELPPTTVLSFRNSYGSAIGLAERIEWIQAGNASGEKVLVQKRAPGEFESKEMFTRASYYLHVSEPERAGHLAQVSWVNTDYGLLMLADLLPLARSETGASSRVRVDFVLPPNWTVASNVEYPSGNFLTTDPDKAVFLIGPALHEKTLRVGSTTFSLITAGKWPFSDDEGIKVARKLLQEYSSVTAHELKRKTSLVLIPFPDDAGPDRWSAETRGDNVVLLLGNKASRKRVLARLAIVLSHELFHLWVPNSLWLAGDYDWFFEGFTLYQALRTDLRLKLISFEDFLDTIARVYDSYLASAERDRLSLIEASERRWTTSSSLVYDKGMLVAFMYDLSLQNLSNCRASSDEIYRQLFSRQATGQENANETIIRLLSNRAELQSFGIRYVRGTEKIDLEAAIAGYGLHFGRDGSRTKLLVAKIINKEQRKLLKCIGYRG
jgi:predicted metalloprotease with PDZ domain